MKIKSLLIILLLFPILSIGKGKSSLSGADFNNLNLDYPGLEKVKSLVANKKYDDAAKTLLAYYKQRSIKHPDYNIQDRAKFFGKPISKDNQEKADKGLEHLFFVHKGYGFIDYGKDINWQHWPIKDNEIRWQLHRTYWWVPMGLAYWSSGDEKYAKEWTFQYLDWIKKNPLGLSKENDRFAWRALEVATRVQDQTAMFNMFISSPYFTPEFLMAFLNNYNKHADYILNNYSDKGNHLLFEAQRMIYAGAFFPEFKDAPAWRKSGIEILNTEIKKQIYADGMQFELSPNYHTAAINIFLKALRMTQLANLDNEFPQSFKNTIEEMIMAQVNFSFPDYTYPMFSDAKLETKESMLKNYKDWLKVFPSNKVIQYYATEGKKGETPKFLSHALKNGGFYTFRNSWKDTATVMVLKASPPAFWHSQPDNGTFDLWVKGRNFMPDAGAYVYGGDEEILKLRNWYRQTRVHKTLTLNNENIDTCDAKLVRWETSDTLDLLVYKNPSYKGLDHYRTVVFVNKKYFIIFDSAVGTTTGNVGIHFQLKEDNEPLYNMKENSVATTYKDGNNLIIRNFNIGQAKFVKEEGKVSYSYRQEAARPAFAFEQDKKDTKDINFTTILYPFNGNQAPKLDFKEEIGNNPQEGKINFSLFIDGKKQTIKHQF
ncbi:Heparinase II/III family protein [Pseudopedobacter saltans DSM 12145]|uniref:Heparinase II/III family protein n=1 Tax=Pseudopedobacter saltans (strain ATCC 51119 / DSM 12145 / JCM 21818 / CCUG 39354 / LMG 10337 / NBRC 100064 / NCIMB 13643) TaxID=762903 RepID=F0S8P2_PSESL|nr:heparin-sulfate lyase HepC [Pseudopedobacter saltans]ADY52373.1 Heparinase II/III family protein [Pseudopedobacter saltans DSM 12145]